MNMLIIYTLLAMAGGLLFGFIFGAMYMAEKVDQVAKASLMAGYDIGVRETLRKYELSEDDLK